MTVSPAWRFKTYAKVKLHDKARIVAQLPDLRAVQPADGGSSAAG
jgi:hypothetical protein